MAFDPETERFDREELRIAAERYVNEYAGVVPDIRSGAPAVADQLRAARPGRESDQSPVAKAPEAQKTEEKQFVARMATRNSLLCAR